MQPTLTFSFSQHLQDSLLVLAIEDDEVIRYLHKMVKPENFLSDLSQTICKVLLDFYTTYQVSPKEHFADLMEEVLKSGKIPEAKVELLIKYSQIS